MFLFVRAVCTIVALTFIAGCAGATHGSSVPSAGRESAERSPATSGAAAPSGTLYIAESHVVDVVPLDANGVTTPTRTITPHPNQDQYITGLAVNTDATLDILEQFYAGGVETSSSGYCRVVVESATADGSPPAVGTNLCDAQPAVTTNGIAANALGGYDVVFFGAPAPNTAVLRRFGGDGTSVVNSLVLNTQPTYLATDRGGHDYIDPFDGTNSRIEMYKGTTTDYLATQWDVTFIGSGFSSIAVSPAADRTVYVVSGGRGGQYINALTPGASSFSRSIGPFAAAITALAIDSQEELYVALNPSGGPVAGIVRVYDGTASGTPTALRAIRLDRPVGVFTGLAISETN